MIMDEKTYSLNKKSAKKALKNKKLLFDNQHFKSDEEKKDFETAMALLEELVNMSDYKNSENFVFKA